MKRFLFILFLLFFLTCGCISQEAGSPGDDDATAACILECQDKKGNVDYASGPCLSNDIKPDWVCDVAHNPRQPVDNEPQNQCSAFREGKAHHFVEVDGNCQVINVF